MHFYGLNLGPPGAGLSWTLGPSFEQTVNLDICIDNVSAIDCSILVQNFTFKVKYRQNQREIPSLLTINFGISEIFAILNYPNLVTCINNITAIDYNILVYNFAFKVKYRQNWREIPSLLTNNFGISEIFAILNYPNLVICISNVTAIDYNTLVYNFTFKLNIDKTEGLFQVCSRSILGYVRYLPFFTI